MLACLPIFAQVAVAASGSSAQLLRLIATLRLLRLIRWAAAGHAVVCRPCADMLHRTACCAVSWMLRIFAKWHCAVGLTFPYPSVPLPQRGAPAGQPVPELGRRLTHAGKWLLKRPAAGAHPPLHDIPYCGSAGACRANPRTARHSAATLQLSTMQPHSPARLPLSPPDSCNRTRAVNALPPCSLLAGSGLRGDDPQAAAAARCLLAGRAGQLAGGQMGRCLRCAQELIAVLFAALLCCHMCCSTPTACPPPCAPCRAAFGGTWQWGRAWTTRGRRQVRALAVFLFRGMAGARTTPAECHCPRWPRWLCCFVPRQPGSSSWQPVSHCVVNQLCVPPACNPSPQ